MEINTIDKLERNFAKIGMTLMAVGWLCFFATFFTPKGIIEAVIMMISIICFFFGMGCMLNAMIVNKSKKEIG